MTVLQFLLPHSQIAGQPALDENALRAQFRYPLSQIVLLKLEFLEVR